MDSHTHQRAHHLQRLVGVAILVGLAAVAFGESPAEPQDEPTVAAPQGPAASSAASAAIQVVDLR